MLVLDEKNFEERILHFTSLLSDTLALDSTDRFPKPDFLKKVYSRP